MVLDQFDQIRHTSRAPSIPFKAFFNLQKIIVQVLTAQKMLKSSRTCESCSKMLLEQPLLEQAVLQKGLDVVQTATEFMESVRYRCTICVAVSDMANFWEGIEDEYTGSFRRLGKNDKLVKNVQFRLSGQDGSKDHLLNPLDPKSYNLDTACIALGSVDSRDHINLYFDVEALDSKFHTLGECKPLL